MIQTRNKDSILASELICELVRSGRISMKDYASIDDLSNHMSCTVDSFYRSSKPLNDDNDKKIYSLSRLLSNMNAEERKSALKIAEEELR